MLIYTGEGAVKVRHSKRSLTFTNHIRTRGSLTSSTILGA